jgi:hypothetical protein
MQTEDTNLFCVHYFAYADRQICGVVNESRIANLHASRFSIVQTGGSVEYML